MRENFIFIIVNFFVEEIRWALSRSSGGSWGIERFVCGFVIFDVLYVRR